MNTLEKEINEYFNCWLQGASDEGCFNPQSQLVSIYDCQRIARHFAQWQKEQMIKSSSQYWYNHLKGFLGEGLAQGVISEYEKYMKGE